MRTLYVPLPEDALARLVELARREFREPKAQAARLILDGLKQADLAADLAADRDRRVKAAQ